MQVVIEMSDDYYEILKYEGQQPNAHVFAKLVANGTPLPKGHGRILDEKDILDTENNDGGWYDLVDMPDYIAGVKAIIEADKENKDVDSN